MSTLTELPEELVAHIAKFLPRNDLLAKRQCNKSSAAAVQRSIQDDDRFAKMIFDALAEPRNIMAEGRIFGSGAKEMVSFCAADEALTPGERSVARDGGAAGASPGGAVATYSECKSEARMLQSEARMLYASTSCQAAP